MARKSIESEHASLRPVDDSDLDLLESWFGNREFVEHWGGKPLSRSEVAAKYLGARRPKVESFVVETPEGPMGYAQYWQKKDAEGGLDLVLIPNAQGKGLGPEVARALSDHLLHGLGWTRVTVDPERTNSRAIAAFKKAGFEKVSDEGSALIMARGRSR